MKIPLFLHLAGIVFLAVLGLFIPYLLPIAIVLTVLLILGILSRCEPTALFTNTATIKGDSTVLWGTASGTTIAGYIVSVRDQLTSEMVEVPDEAGFAVAVVFFNQKNECEVELIIKTSVPSLAIGDSVTIAGIASCIVIDREVLWEQKGVRKLRVKATKWSGF